jgi:Protein of unknown function (DUF551)
MSMTFDEFYEEKCSTNWQDWTVKGIAKESWNAATEAAKPRWIPVSERLPDREGWFAVKTESPSTFDKGYFNKTLGIFDDINYSKVTHWIDLSKLVE